MKANSAKSKATQDAVTHTIKELRLNLDDSLVQTRFNILQSYSKGNIDMAFLEGFYPFIAAELKRQGLQDSIKGQIPSAEAHGCHTATDRNHSSANGSDVRGQVGWED